VVVSVNGKPLDALDRRKVRLERRQLVKIAPQRSQHETERKHRAACRDQRGEGRRSHEDVDVLHATDL
jgi:hypothetical protein